MQGKEDLIWVHASNATLPSMLILTDHCQTRPSDKRCISTATHDPKDEGKSLPCQGHLGELDLIMRTGGRRSSTPPCGGLASARGDRKANTRRGGLRPSNHGLIAVERRKTPPPRVRNHARNSSATSQRLCHPRGEWLARRRDVCEGMHASTTSPREYIVGRTSPGDATVGALPFPYQSTKKGLWWSRRRSRFAWWATAVSLHPLASQAVPLLLRAAVGVSGRMYCVQGDTHSRNLEGQETVGGGRL